MTRFPQSSPLPGPVLARVMSARVARRTAASVAAGRVASDRLLDEVLFHDALARERRRADRFEDAFVVALISLDEDRPLQGSWNDIVDALSVKRFEADLLGWYRQGTVLGLIRSASSHESVETRGFAAAAMLRDLRHCLPAGLADGRDVHVETYDPRGNAVPPVFLAEPERPTSVPDVVRTAGKRAIDIVGSATLLLLLVPLILCVSVAVKASSPGPILHLQQRVGRHGRLFPMFKFRTMHADAVPALHREYVERFIQAGAQRPTGAETVCKIVNDPRVTRLGRWLRRSSVDEVPQFWNVLTGDMSLVGPRPPLPYEMESYKSWHRRRVLDAKPGMTGLWQVSGRSQTSFDEMVRLDLHYARTWSLWLDLKILLATPVAVFTGKGAY